MSPTNAARPQIEFDLVSVEDRVKPPPSLLRSIQTLITRHPHARLVRDGVGDHKYVISEMGTSRVLGTGNTARGAWESAALTDVPLPARVLDRVHFNNQQVTN